MIVTVTSVSCTVCLYKILETLSGCDVKLTQHHQHFQKKNRSPAKKLRMRSSPHEVNRVPFNLINQQKVAADVAFPVVGPIAFERVVQPLSAQRAIVGNQQQHRLLELPHVVVPGARQPLPVF